MGQFKAHANFLFALLLIIYSLLNNITSSLGFNLEVKVSIVNILPNIQDIMVHYKSKDDDIGTQILCYY